MRDEEPVLDADEIQGNILAGFRKDHQTLLFLEVVDPKRARAWLLDLVPSIATLREVHAYNSLYKSIRNRRGRGTVAVRATWINIAFSAPGLSRITGEKQRLLDDRAFADGMPRRAAQLGDPADPSEAGHPARWRVGRPDAVPDILIVVASDDPAWLGEEVARLESTFGDGVRLMYREDGHALPYPLVGREHFGFKDGVSQPRVLGRLSDSPGDYLESGGELLEKQRSEVLMQPGEFVLGYRGHDPARSADTTWFARNGSFLVYRRLVQDVELFERFLREASDELRRRGGPFADLTPEKLGANLMGRWHSGVPLVKSPDRDQPSGDDNDFGYAGDNGSRCPFAAHIRKTNPRDDPRAGGTSVSLSHRIIRRGIPFRTPGGTEVGLHFLCYQASIERQFEFIMQQWSGNPDFPERAVGTDPILATAHGPATFPFRLEVPGGRAVEVTLQVPRGLVTPTGGGYFFSPSITAVKAIGEKEA